MSEQTLTGVCTEVAQKPGSDWVEFHIDAGGKYPVRLSTKLQPLIELGKAAGVDLATWTYNEVESEKINEKSGKPYVNRYLERVEVGGSVPEPDHPAPETWAEKPASSVATPQPRVYTPDLKDRMIVRQTCLKAASELLAGKPSPPVAPPGAEPLPDLPLQVMKAAQRFETWVYRDIDPVPFAPDLSEHDAGIPF